jgi:nucleoside-diphosphate-sugar epimerase
MNTENRLVSCDDRILVTGAAGFIGRRVVECLLEKGYRNVVCLSRQPGASLGLQRIIMRHASSAQVEVAAGNLLSPRDCLRITNGATLIYHLAAGRSDMYADAFMNSVVTTRNLLDAALHHGCLRRFVNVSSFSVYSNRHKPNRRILDETCPIEQAAGDRGDPYMFGKVKQDEIVMKYGRERALPYVIVRPGYVYGEGHETISNRVGIGTFGLFLHLGGRNPIPLTYVDNCAEAIVLAGLTPAIDGEVFNVVDDDVPTSREFLRMYKRNVRRFPSLYVPHWASHFLCCLWEKYSAWSQGQLPPTFNSKGWHAFWKYTRYTNAKLKTRLGWSQRVPSSEGLSRYFQACRERTVDA